MKVLSNLSLYGTLGLNSVVDANTDTDKFLVMDSSGIVKYRTGQELYNDIGAGGAASYTSTLQHEVKAGVALTKGQAVYVTGADGTNMIVGLASNASEATSSKTLGLIAQDLNVNGKGFVITEGLLSGLNTMAAGVEGDPVWLGTDGNLIYGLGSKPYAPAHLVFIGIVTRKNANNGEIFIKVQNGFELQEIHNVQITSTPSDNTVLAYETSTSLYKMKSIPTLLGYTPTTNARTLTINGTSYDLSADRSWSVGTHTGNLTTGYVPKATGATTLTDSLIYDNGSAIGINTNSPYESSAFKLDVNGGVIIKNTSGTAAQLILINSNPATGGNNGFVQLSAGGNTSTAFGQWQTYYGMSVASGALRLQPAGGQVLIGTTTTSAFTTDINGTLRVSGQLTLGSTISNNTYVYTMPGASGTLALVSDIPSLSGYVPTSRTLTINGTSYDLSSNRSWSVGTVVGNSNVLSDANGTNVTVNGGYFTGFSPSNIPSGQSSGDWGLMTFPLWTGNSSGERYVVQLAANLDQNDNIYIRKFFNFTSPYRTAWHVLLNSSNFSSYAVPTSRTITINGTTLDLSANRSFTVTAIETDTLASVTGRGNTTTSSMAIGSGSIPNGRLYVNSGSGSDVIALQNSLNTGAYLVFADNVTPTWANAPRLGAISNDMVFKTLDTERMRITANGEAGIGVTPSSGNRFWVKGNDSTSSNTSIIAQNSAGTFLFFVRNDGNVGIGTGSPSYKLHVYTSDNEGIYLQGTGGGIWMNIKSASGKMWSYGAQNDGCGIYNRTDGVYRMFITDSGATTFSGTIAASNISSGVNVSHIVQRDGNGYIYANHVNFSTSESENPTISSFITSNGDGWSRKSSIAHVRNQLGNYGNWITASALSSYLPLSGGVMTGSIVNNTDGSVIIESNATENNNWLWKENAKAWGLFWFNKGSQSGQTIGSYSTIGAELMFMGESTGIAMPSGWTGYHPTSKIAAMISNYNGYIYSASTVFAAGDMRAPIFYDSQDTGYYVDPNSTSRLVQVNLGTTNTRMTSSSYTGYIELRGSSSNYLGIGCIDNNGWGYIESLNNSNGLYFQVGSGRYAFDTGDLTPYNDAENSLGNPSYRWSQVYTSGWFRNYGAQGMYNQDYGTHFYSSGGGSWNITGNGGNVELVFRSNHQSTIRGYVYANTSNQIGFLSEDGNWVLRTWNRGVEAYGQMRAPIFYDSNDTTYYLDPNESSSTPSLKVAGNIDLYARSAGWAEGIRVRVPSTNTWGGIRFTRDRGNNDGNWAIGFTGIDSTDDLTFWANDGGSEGMKMRISKAGMVGIGTSPSGSYRLSVAGHLHMNYNSIDYVSQIYQETGGQGNYMYANSAGSYGTLRLTSTRNGWYGIYFDSGTTLMMNSNESGHYREGYGWQYRWDNGTLYCHKNSYGGGTSATVWDSINAPRASNSNLVYYAGFTLDADSMPTNSTGFTYSNNAPTTGPIVRFGDGGYDLELNAYYYWGDQLYYRVRNGDVGSWRAWRRVMDDSAYPYAANMNQYLRTSDSPTFNVVYAASSIRFNQDVSADNTFGIYFASSGASSYGIYREGGSWSWPYPDLRIAFHTGIKIGANAGYGGMKFYSDYDMSTIVASINDGDTNMRGYYDIIAYASDRRLKENVQVIGNAVDKVKQLTGMTYTWNSVGAQYGWSPSSEREAGVFAQDVQAVLPEAVRLAPFDNNMGVSKSGQNFLTVKYEKIVPLLIEAIKEQQKQIEDLKSELNGITK
jgi:predicted heme/steroid binding protein